MTSATTDSLTSHDGSLAVHFKDANRMIEVPDMSIDLVVTSPPYGIGLAYNADNDKTRLPVNGQVEGAVTSWKEYQAYLRRLAPVWKETYRTMAPGAYACINIAPIHTKSALFHEDSSMLPTTERIAQFWLDELGARYRWRYIWIAWRTRNNGKGDPQSFLGSYGLRDAPGEPTYGLPLRGQVLREIEEIIVFQKGPLVISDERETRRRNRLSRLTREEWRDTFSQVWEFPGDSDPQHPAVFPEELPRRLIRGYSCAGDRVLDPFMGTGTTGRVAHQMGRRFVGYEIERSFIPLVTAKLELGVSDLEALW